ncbi:MAG: hypothetical protein KAY32_07215 [Candidatus Eisenbacteria sp.]|nr:hypothetical protein [Candidatus Eisenbacteria bacterium]
MSRNFASLGSWFLLGVIVAAVGPAVAWGPLEFFSPRCAQAQDVLAGCDLYSTDGTTTYRDFTSQPIPADFFGPGSDPFDGVVCLCGSPLGTSFYCPNDDLSFVDQIVLRSMDAPLPGIGAEATIPIEIVELSLVSIEPITVTYFGGMESELWDVTLVLSPTAPSLGEMVLRHETAAGGTFDAYYELYPLLVFENLDSGLSYSWDLGDGGMPDLLSALDVPWEYRDPVSGSCRSNFCPHRGALQSYGSLYMVHTVSSLCPPGPEAVLPGFDLFETDPVPSFWNFAGEPLPADFFGPGSDPFDGVICLHGSPLWTSPFCPADDLTRVDTIVERMGPAEHGDTIETEIVELSLVSSEPITVTYFGGIESELWDVAVDLSLVEASVGAMTIWMTGELGGIFDHEYWLAPRFTFVRQSDNFTVQWDCGMTGSGQFFAAHGVPWVYVEPPFESCTSNFCPGPGGSILYQAPYAVHAVISICPGLSAIGDQHEAADMDQRGLYLAPITPNPSSAGVEIRYAIPGTDGTVPVALEILDVTGRRVASLRNAPHAPGEYRLSWAGTDNQGRRVADGIYFSRLAMGGREMVRRVIMIK